MLQIIILLIPSLIHPIELGLAKERTQISSYKHSYAVVTRHTLTIVAIDDEVRDWSSVKDFHVISQVVH